MSKTIGPFLIVAAVFFFWVSAVEASAPNILVIVADDLGYADIGVHGARDISTPAIDSLAHNGIRFTNGYVSGPYCSPTRAGLLTGRYQQRFGHEFNMAATSSRADLEVFALPLTETTLADRFKAAGYRTGMVGKWHLGGQPEFHPLKRGFQEFFGFLSGSHSYVDSTKDTSNPILRNHEQVDEPDYLTDAFGREACAFIRRNQGQPWFLYLTFNAVHRPLQATSKYLERHKDIQDKDRRTYAAMMSAMDDAIGSVMGVLHDRGLEDNTLIFFISDNGGPLGNSSMNGSLRGQKGETWEGGIRVPFLMQWKGKIPAGITYDLPVIQLDIFPTTLAAAGIKVQPEWNIDGINLTPYLTGKINGTPHEALYWRLGERMAVRMGDWKLVKSPEGDVTALTPSKGDLSGVQLFHLATDIGERNDLAEQEPERVRVLKAVWTEWSSGLEEPRWLPLSKAGQKGQSSR